MAKFLIGLVTGILVVVLTAVLAVISLARFGADRRVSVASNSVLMLELEGDLPERAPVELPIPFLEQQAPSTVVDVWDTLRKAAADARIKAVILEPRGLGIGWGKAQEIRSAIEKFRKSGKPVFAYLRTPGTREYYLATAADKIYVTPEEYLNVKGLRVEAVYLKRTLEKLGVQAEFEHVGKYKDAGDMFTRDGMSPETREVLNGILDDLYGHLTDTIARARTKTPGEVRAILDDGPFLGTQAKAKGLVDGLLYHDQMLDELKRHLKLGDFKRVSHKDYARVSAASLGLEGGPRLAVLVGEGGITRGGAGDEGFGDESGIGAEGFNKVVRRLARDASIKGVILRIDSPGGDAIASDDIWREMSLLSKKKPVVISMSDVAASGGYYVAMTGDPVVAYPGTLTGSIGVLYGKVNLRGLYDKIGVTKEILKRGRYADVDSDYGPLSDAARRKLREGIETTYKTFVKRVADGRKRKFEEIEPLAQGRVWLGSQAKQHGLVDELGGLDSAIDLLKRKAKIGKDEKVTLVLYPPKRSIFEIAFGRGSESVFESKLGVLLKSWQLRLFAQGGLMRLMPYTVDVR